MVTTATSIEQLSINTIRTLAIDAIEKANSGHPGLPMGAAPMAYTLWTEFLKHNPTHSKWFKSRSICFVCGAWINAVI